MPRSLVLDVGDSRARVLEANPTSAVREAQEDLALVVCSAIVRLELLADLEQHGGPRRRVGLGQDRRLPGALPLGLTPLPALPGVAHHHADDHGAEQQQQEPHRRRGYVSGEPAEELVLRLGLRLRLGQGHGARKACVLLAQLQVLLLSMRVLHADQGDLRLHSVVLRPGQLALLQRVGALLRERREHFAAPDRIGGERIRQRRGRCDELWRRLKRQGPWSRWSCRGRGAGRGWPDLPGQRLERNNLIGSLRPLDPARACCLRRRCQEQQRQQPKGAHLPTLQHATPSTRLLVGPRFAIGD
mmetsp:Transcript_59280/g.152605  ORF Transcript_59280/g.152605 Transcript_59280/m.152605 type:complete len:301 (-) Transcript_59280:27-929(-)